MTDQAPLRVDKFLIDRVPNISRTKIQNYARTGCVLVNGSAVKPNHKVKAHDVITLIRTIEEAKVVFEKVKEEVEAFFETDWPAYKEAVEQVELSPFKD